MIVSTQFKTLPSMHVRVVAEVFSDEVIRYEEGFFRGIVGRHTENWGIIGKIGDKGLRIVSDWLEVPGTSSVEEVFSNINPGFFPTNCNLSYQYSLENQFVPSKK